MRLRCVICVIAAIANMNTNAQVFTGNTWNQNNLVSLKASQLYYEVTIGANLFPQKNHADFMYMSFGYGKPNKKNAWRKFTPENVFSESLPKSLKEKLTNSGTDDLHAVMINLGWNHWFNHVLGCYVQSGWGGIVDLSTNDDLTEEEKTLLANTRDKAIFIYHTVPVELGLTLNVWKHYIIQAGITYMWKEIPLFTIGVGYAF